MAKVMMIDNINSNNYQTCAPRS